MCVLRFGLEGGLNKELCMSVFIESQSHFDMPRGAKNELGGPYELI